MTAFHIGQKVVFVDDSGIENPGIIGNKYKFTFPTKGSVYTIRGIVRSDFSGDDLLLLEEIDNREAADASGWLKEPGAEACRFRPVVERKTSIAIFHEILNKTRTGVSA
ncbi:hypothetical protein ELI01_18850 [Rhizobium leguminosarum]|uniref:hypothetical protein n=1 Tax=Rhizobium leguminosarum TaxID=384 RepID=UPI0010310029|nr:hypothetical protein [Rhizobium leguminosarum]TAX57138.1 hypothetical protein ELI01_18850 [Rhizobium leguminosarum]